MPTRKLLGGIVLTLGLGGCEFDCRDGNSPFISPERPPEPILLERCTVPTGYVATFDGRNVYRVDLDLNLAAEPCALRTSTTMAQDPTAHIYIGYLAGSPGYSINARDDYAITFVQPGTLRPDGSAADVLEDQVISFTVERRADAGAAIGVPAPEGRLEIQIRMNGGNDPWTVTQGPITR